MKRVVTVNLGGRAYQLEEDGYAILAEYLEESRTRLRGNPDMAEILLDLELAIADKAELFLNTRKNVVTTREIERIVEEMGLVDDVEDYGRGYEQPSSRADGSERDTGSTASRPQTPRNRLYRLTGKDKMLAGVCAGLAARSGIDVSLVRIAFVALALATSGLGVIAYIALALLMPSADTPLEAAASGGAPFRVREIIDAVHDKLHGARAARRERRCEAHWHGGHRGGYAHGSRHGHERHGHRSSVLRFGMLVVALLIGLYALQQWHFIHQGPWWFLRSFYAAGGASPVWPVLAIVLVAGFLLWRFAGARRRTTRAGSGGSFAASSLKLLVALVLAWFAFQLIGGDPHVLSPRPYFYVNNAWGW